MNGSVAVWLSLIEVTSSQEVLYSFYAFRQTQISSGNYRVLVPSCTQYFFWTYFASFFFFLPAPITRSNVQGRS